MLERLQEIYPPLGILHPQSQFCALKPLGEIYQLRACVGEFCILHLFFKLQVKKREAAAAQECGGEYCSYCSV